jgi:DNA repair exonuclease SbcCD ATPase subunit
VELIEQGKDDLIPIYDKYSGSTFEEEDKEANEFAGQTVKAMMEMALGVELGDDVDFSSPEQLAELLHQKVQEQEEIKRQAHESRGQRKKTAKQIEREAKKEQEEQTISQSIREAYRKLSSSLHPDREQDPSERERKTELMQRVNAAYAKKDLLKLLELQLEVEQIDPAYINNIAEDRLKYINKVLQGQLAELEQEIQGLIYPLQMQLSIPPYMAFTPEILMRHLRFDIQEMGKNIRKIKRDLSDFKELPALKSWLKSYRIPKANPYNEIDGMIQAFNFRY